MKESLKEGLRRVGLLEPAQRLYFNSRAASPAVIAYELRHGHRAAPDGFAVPSAGLIFDVIACRWAKVYLDSGRQIVSDMEAALRQNGRSLVDFRSILDFGCGSGRLIRHVWQRSAGVANSDRATHVSLQGTDYNPELTAWCREHLPFADFKTNELGPPLIYPDDSFDFIYARSIFTHLTEDLQRTWMRELRRVLEPGGVLYFTMHGEQYTGGLTEDERGRYDSGELVVRYPEMAGKNFCATYASPTYVRSTLLDALDLIDHIRGRPKENLRQDIYLVQAPL